MAIPMETARRFLEERRIALVGVSRDAKDFTRMVMRELVRRGYDVVPVHPGVQEIDGRTCFARVQEVAPKVGAALIFTPASATDAVLRDCLDAGVLRVWLHRGAGHGAASAGALAFCAANGMEAVHDLCPFMALPGASLIPHRMHGFVRRKFGRAAHERRA
jgi:uncharacterized protein